MQLTDMIKQIDKRKNEVGKVRDSIDHLLDEMTALRDNCDEAYECLQRASDALSEQV
jgi:predicted  nucleic acid-binding Zn-ribbon protein